MSKTTNKYHNIHEVSSYYSYIGSRFLITVTVSIIYENSRYSYHLDKVLVVLPAHCQMANAIINKLFELRELQRNIRVSMDFQPETRQTIVNSIITSNFHTSYECGHERKYSLPHRFQGKFVSKNSCRSRADDVF